MIEDKIKYIVIRGLSAIVDILFYATIMKLLSPYIGTKNADGNYYTNTLIGILFYYIIQLSQDIVFGKTFTSVHYRLKKVL